MAVDRLDVGDWLSTAWKTNTPALHLLVRFDYVNSAIYLVCLRRTTKQLDVCHIIAVKRCETTLSTILVVGLYDCS